MNNLSAQQQVAAIYQAILGNKADVATLNFFGYQLSSGKLLPNQLASKLITSPDGQARLQGMSNEEKINYIYNNIAGSQPDAATLARLVTQLEQGRYLGTITANIIKDLDAYAGDDAATLAQQAFLEHNVATTLSPAFNKPAEFIPDAANIQAIYYITGAAVVAEGVNFWANYLHNNPDKLAYVAQKFVEGRPAVASLTNEDFIRTLFQNTFKQAATPEEIAHYIAGLENNSETRGDVVAKMLNDIRNDTTHPTAKAQFDQATHVYLAGEMPAAAYQETVAAFYLTIAKTTVSATSLDTWSKMLASGTSEAALLKMLAKSAQFSTAGDFAAVYKSLYNGTLSAAESQAILLKAGNDKYAATALIINAFRDGEYPLDNHPAPPSHTLVQNYETTLGSSLNYQHHFNGTLSVSAEGKLTAAINNHTAQELTNAEISSLTLLSVLKIDATSNHSIELSFLPQNITEIELGGNYSTSSQVLASFTYKQHVTLRLDNDNIANAGGTLQLPNATVIVDEHTNLDTANIHIRLGAEGMLSWDGNGVNGSANSVGKNFTAENMYAATSPFPLEYGSGTISANLITKDIYLTSGENGDVQGSIVSNLNQFLYFSFIDLTHYRGTGNIYMNGQLVATEGSNVFDFGVTDQRATIFNQAYSNVSSLQQADGATQHNGNYTGSFGPVISAYSGELTLLNLSSSYLRVNGDLTSQSRINIYDTLQSDKTFTLSLTDESANLRNLDLGTISLTSAHKDKLSININSGPSSVIERSLTLSGGDNHISTLSLSGLTRGNDMLLNLTIKSDFSDNLKTITGVDASMGPVFSLIDLNLVSEKSGTGGGGFYNTLKTLSNSAEFGTVIDALAGDQLNVSSEGLSVHSAQVVGNTTVDTTQKLTFADSKIDNLVTLNKNFEHTSITVGSGDAQWQFSSGGPKSVALYGSATTTTELNTLFGGLSATDSAQELFSQALAKLTHGTSTNNLSEVGVVKLDKSVYVIVDQNHNQTFDANDYVFSIGNQDPYLAASALHYSSPAVTTNGTAETSLEAVI
ncbi:DUF4214 domain-containing protein [Serratia inhibens]|uniref:DUF4214 domain-containing protein n=1 Tax=Serratia inhibens TaxID=2338073 RepID=UPI00080996D0|nr:DUF4214 domain-containing protein [Serratia inhibens]ANS42720.1 hypothetical protein Q5A_011325 [Serratia inhibens PRI-2C]